MQKSVLERLAEEEHERPKRPYIPFHAALESGLLDLNNIVRRKLIEPIGVTIANGMIPQQNDAGIVGLSDESIIAVDHAQVASIDSSRIEIAPSDKRSVDKGSGAILETGIISINNLDGLLRIVGITLDRSRAEWSDTRTRLRVGLRASGLVTIMFGLDAEDFEYDDMDPSNGHLRAKPRRNYW